MKKSKGRCSLKALC